MITTLEMFGVECDNCKQDYIDDSTGFCAWTDAGLAHEAADGDGWYTDDYKHYCPKCFTVDENDNLILIQCSPTK